MTQIAKKEKAPHPAHLVFAEVPADKTLVRVYNKREGALKHEIRIEDGTTVNYEIPGNSFAKVPKDVADLWLAHFPDRIVTDNEAQKLVAGAQAEADKLREQLAKVQSDLAAAKAKSDPKGELAKAQAELARLREENASLLEKATAPAPASDSGI